MKFTSFVMLSFSFFTWELIEKVTQTRGGDNKKSYVDVGS